MAELRNYRGTAWTVLILGAILASGCALFDSDRQAITDKWKTIRLVSATPEVQKLIENAEHLNRANVSETEDPEQDAFVDAMLNQRGIEVPAGSYVRIVQQSKAVCTKQPYRNPVFIKVRVTTGSAKGQTGWGCLGVDITLVNTLP